MILLLVLFSAFICWYYLPHVYHTYAVHYFEKQGDEAVVSHRMRALLFFITVFLPVLFLPILGWKSSYQFYILLIPIIISIAYFDIKFQVIPDRFHFMAVAVILLQFFNQGASYRYTDLLSLAIGYIFVCLLVFSNFIYSKLRKQHGIGWGDIKLLAWMTLILKEAVIVVFFVSIVLGLCVQLLKKIVRKKHSLKDYFAFGPYLMTILLFVLLLSPLR